MKEQLNKASTRRMILIFAQTVQCYLPGHKIEELEVWGKINQGVLLLRVGVPADAQSVRVCAPAKRTCRLLDEVLQRFQVHRRHQVVMLPAVRRCWDGD